MPRHRAPALILLAACAGLFLPACVKSRAPSAPQNTRPARQSARQPAAGVFHRIGAGQTLHTISKTYGVTVETLLTANDLADRNRIEAGQTAPAARDESEGSHAD